MSCTRTQLLLSGQANVSVCDPLYSSRQEYYSNRYCASKYSADPEFEDFFRLLRHGSCLYFMAAAVEFDTDYYYEFYDQFHLGDNIDEPIDGSDTDEY